MVEAIRAYYIVAPLRVGNPITPTFEPFRGAVSTAIVKRFAPSDPTHWVGTGEPNTGKLLMGRRCYDRYTRQDLVEHGRADTRYREV